MNKQDVLDIVKLPSAIEAWSFANKSYFPDYLHDQLTNIMDTLEKELFK